MELTIKGTPAEIKEALQAIGSSKERLFLSMIDGEDLTEYLARVTMKDSEKPLHRVQ